MNKTKNTFTRMCAFTCIALCVSLTACEKRGAKVSEERLKTVVAYAYDSFSSDWGPGKEIATRFEKKTGYTLDLINCGSAMQALNRAILEKNAVVADVVIGIDNSSADIAREANILEAYTPENATQIIDSSVQAELGNDHILTPYDFGHFAMIYDTQSTVPRPSSLNDLTKEVYKNRIILMDPRTSSTGLGFASWTVSTFGADYANFWAALKPNILSMTSGWSEGWGMFLNGEAPLVVSYSTSPAYNVEYESNDRFVALIFSSGHVEQVEGAGLLKGAPNEKGAKAFLDFLISTEAQDIIPLTQWMYPVNGNVDLPESYKKAAPLPDMTLKTDAKATRDAIETIMGILGH